MPQKTDDPALDWGVRAFWVVTVLAMVLIAVFADFRLRPSLAERIFMSSVGGTVLGVTVGTSVYVAGFFYQRAGERREVKEQQREATQWADTTRALGPRYASIVEATRAAVNHDICESEAARAGLLGDIDFNADIRGITDNLLKAHELQKVADTLASLDKPSADDRKILAEAKATVTKLETAALNRVGLIAKCATEAQLVDKSLRDERQDAKTSAQRAELHAKLAAMLYGIEATPDTTPKDSAADGVLVRVRAYRELKNQIRLVRD